MGYFWRVIGEGEREQEKVGRRWIGGFHICNMRCLGFHNEWCSEERRWMDFMLLAELKNLVACIHRKADSDDQVIILVYFNLKNCDSLSLFREFMIRFADVTLLWRELDRIGR